MWERASQRYFQFLEISYSRNHQLTGWGLDLAQQAALALKMPKWGINFCVCVCVHACVSLMSQPLGLGGFIVLGVEQAHSTVCLAWTPGWE